MLNKVLSRGRRQPKHAIVGPPLARRPGDQLIPECAAQGSSSRRRRRGQVLSPSSDLQEREAKVVATWRKVKAPAAEGRPRDVDWTVSRGAYEAGSTAPCGLRLEIWSAAARSRVHA